MGTQLLSMGNFEDGDLMGGTRLCTRYKKHGVTVE